MKLSLASLALLGMLSSALAANLPRAPAQTTSSASASSSLPIINTFTTTSKGKTTSKSSTSTSTSSTSTITELAIFTNAGVVWTVTSFDGTEAIDGYTLLPGQVQNIGGENLSQRPNGNVYAGGTKLEFVTYSASTMPSMSAAMSSGSMSASMSGGASSSSAAAKSSGGTSTGAAVAMRTAGPVGMGVVAAVLGVVVL